MPAELGQAVEVLQYLSRAGSGAAEQRLQDIRQFYSHVWSDEMMTTTSPSNQLTLENSQERGSQPGARASNRLDEPVGTSSIHQTSDNMPPPPPYNAQNAGTALPPNQDGQMQIGSLIDFDKGYDFEIDLDVDAEGIYSSFFDPNLPLTGVDQMDWAEMEKVFTSRTA